MNGARRSTPDLSGARWRTSTYSGGNNECLEVGDNVPHLVSVRDSKRPTGPVIAFGAAAWRTFIGVLG
ncbi:DUF397 domain-containing protein [Streptomyces sp. NPDC049967]|uniref:DUF397 domain-containing protein n=1 Tax=unclassified Streptomyces TaxID=2593676 RepID=UPI002E0FACA5|nr:MULTISPECIES: DUF397 domain-containing protein [unclassified Streptomyces]WSJ25249.1 DUF397 domain-containing protein [Streptomyces sp. NBC_01324]